jgi:hypothetical protein
MFIFVLGLTLFAQSSDDAQRIIGIWKADGRDIFFTINSNGTYMVSGTGLQRQDTGKYTLSDSKLIFLGNSGGEANISDYYLSTDGHILVFTYRFASGPLTFWYVKQ